MKHKWFCGLCLLCGLTHAGTVSAQSEMTRFVDELMSRMTLEEKLGQLNQLPGDDINTGTPSATRIGKEVTAGRVGSVLNVQGVDKIRALQQVAVEESRLGIPLLVGLDVIHGYETLFPIPLGLSCTWDMEAVERSAHIAATEAGANALPGRSVPWSIYATTLVGVARLKAAVKTPSWAAVLPRPWYAVIRAT